MHGFRIDGLEEVHQLGGLQGAKSYTTDILEGRGVMCEKILYTEKFRRACDPRGTEFAPLKLRVITVMLHYVCEINLNTAEIFAGLQMALTARLRDLHNILQHTPHTSIKIRVSIKTMEFCYHRSVF